MPCSEPPEILLGVTVRHAAQVSLPSWRRRRVYFSTGGRYYGNAPQVRGAILLSSNLWSYLPSWLIITPVNFHVVGFSSVRTKTDYHLILSYVILELSIFCFWMAAPVLPFILLIAADTLRRENRPKEDFCFFIFFVLTDSRTPCIPYWH